MPKAPKAPDKAIAKKIRFIGTVDQYVAGVPQADLDIVETVTDDRTQVTLERARELVATRLFVPEGGEIPSAEDASDDEGATAPEEA